MNFKRKDNKKKTKDKKKSNKLWHLLQIQSLKTKKNKLDLKMKKWLDTSIINWKKKNKRRKEDARNKKNRKNKWENIWPDKSMRKRRKIFKKRKSMKNKQKYGNKIHKTFSKMKKVKLSIWSQYISSMKAFWRSKWRRSKKRRIGRKWTLFNFSTTRPWWRQLQIKTITSKSQRFDNYVLLIPHFWSISCFYISYFRLFKTHSISFVVTKD